MKSILGLLGVLGLGLTACSDAETARRAGSDFAEQTQAIIRPTSQGGDDRIVMLHVTALDETGLLTRTCTGSYFASRVVLTAAHCLEGVLLDQVFVYFGDDAAGDFSQLTRVGDLLIPPAPGQPSLWAKADSFETHPEWDPQLLHPDLAVVYLDRKLPFEPLPLARFRIDNTWLNKTATISGWGANAAPEPRTGTGLRVQRTGNTRILGSPTAADYHAEDPNPGILVPSVRQRVLKVDGRAPNSNACFGDSGAPLLVTRYGLQYVAGVHYFTGLFCEDYSLYTRLEPFLPFLDAASKKGGFKSVIPKFECVAPNANGSFTAYFGYENKNGVAIEIARGPRNALALDVNAWRPTRFLPGTHDFVLGVDFTSHQTVSYTLSPDVSPSTCLTVTRSSHACGAAEADPVECGPVCRAALRSTCPELPTFAGCMNECVQNIQFVRDIAPQCLPENAALNLCLSQTPPGTDNWTCLPGALPPSQNCNPELEALFTCLGI